MTNAYLYAGSTLMLTGLIDAASRRSHPYSGEVASCPICRDRIEMEMRRWRQTQATLEWVSRPRWASRKAT